MRFLRTSLSELGLSPARFQIMEALRQGQARSMVDLADRLSVTKRNITSLVDGMEKDGLATRQPHPTDRRSILVALTPKGEAAFREAAMVQQNNLDQLMSRLDASQQKALSASLVKLTDELTGSDET